MRLAQKASRLVVFLIFALLTAASATYIPWNGRGPVGEVSSIPDQKSNSIGQEQSSTQRRRHKSVFRNDADVYRYLKGLDRQLMIWKCRNAIQSYWHYKPLPFIVEVTEVDVSRYSYSIETHYDAGHYYSAWLDFRLRIFNATQRDSGIYRFRVTSPTGDADHRLVYVDISEPPTTTSTPTTISTSGSDPADPEVFPARPERRKPSHKASRRRRLKMRRRRRKKLERRQRRGPSSTAPNVEVEHSARE